MLNNHSFYTQIVENHDHIPMKMINDIAHCTLIDTKGDRL